MRVRCVDNTLCKNILTVGDEYDVIEINSYYKDYRLDGVLGWHHPRRFIPSGKASRTNVIITPVAPRPEPIVRFRPLRRG